MMFCLRPKRIIYASRERFYNFKLIWSEKSNIFRYLICIYLIAVVDYINCIVCSGYCRSLVYDGFKLLYKELVNYSCRISHIPIHLYIYISRTLNYILSASTIFCCITLQRYCLCWWYSSRVFAEQMYMDQ